MNKIPGQVIFNEMSLKLCVIKENCNFITYSHLNMLVLPGTNLIFFLSDSFEKHSEDYIGDEIPTIQQASNYWAHLEQNLPAVTTLEFALKQKYIDFI